tara:strand:+ start:1779 stop:2024 length:246 start_codon:yes stop_codon:yes gene_type:complete
MTSRIFFYVLEELQEENELLKQQLEDLKEENEDLERKDGENEYEIACLNEVISEFNIDIYRPDIEIHTEDASTELDIEELT